MKLLLDLGNSCCKWATIRDADWQSEGSFPYLNAAPQAAISRLIETLPVQLCTHVHAVSVLGEEFNRHFEDAVISAGDAGITFHYPCSEGFGLHLGHTDITTFGADRFAALVGAWQGRSGAILVVDCGTAVTLDAVDSAGQHMGGMIIPGIEVTNSALVSRAPGVFVESEVQPVEYFNRTTSSAVRSGSTLCLRHGLRSIIDHMRALMGEDVAVLITGGARTTLLDLSDNTIIVRPDLVLEGLEIMQRT